MKEEREICRIVQKKLWKLPKMICFDHYMEAVSQAATLKNLTICYQLQVQISGEGREKVLTRNNPNLKIAIEGITSRSLNIKMQ